MKDFNNYLTSRTDGVLSKQLQGLWRMFMALIVVFLIMGSTAFAQKPAASLEQVRNGGATTPVSPGNWQNGNLNSSQAHFVESHSIPYRALLTGLPTNRDIVLIIGFDVTHSSKNAIDYLTHYDRLQPHGQFFHSQEIIDPTIGTSFSGAPNDTEPIPAPYGGNTTGLQGIAVSSYNNLVTAEPGKNLMSLWGGNIISVEYVTPYADLTSAQAEQRIRVTFRASSSSAVLAWGGHIASRSDWGFTAGVPNSAGGISGSPYHMRLVDWNISNLGNQDRSLAAAAVIAPPECSLTGTDEVCAGSISPYSTSVVADSYTWSIINNTSGAYFTSSSSSTDNLGTSITTPSPVYVNAGPNGGNYTVKLVTTRGGIVSTDLCQVVVDVNKQPVITVQPQPQNICESAAASFSVTYTDGNPPATLQWQLSTDNGTTFNNISNGGIYSGATTATLSLSSTALAISGNQYRVVLTSGSICGPVTSDPALLTVNKQPVITAQPQPQAKCVGASASFSVTYTDGNPAATLQWQVKASGDATFSNITNGGVYSGATTATLNISSTTLAMSGNQYRVVLTSGTICDPVTSDAATLTVNDLPSTINAVYIAPATCTETTYSVRIDDPEAGIYTLSHNGSEFDFEYPADGDEVLFSGLTQGIGFSVSFENVSGCPAEDYICPASEANTSIGAQSSVQSVQGINEVESKTLTAYPIPFYNDATVEFASESSGNYVVNLYDMKGSLIRELKSGEAKKGELNRIEVDGRSLPDGIYFVRFVNGNGAKSIKLLKRR